MKINIAVCNSNPELDLQIAAHTCRGNRENFKEKFTKENWIKWLIAEHTPIETIQLRIEFSDMDKSAIAQFVRHTDKQPRHFVQSSRPDLNGGKPRDPNALIMYTCFYNPQALILMMRKRLCYSAEKRTRLIAAQLKKELMMSEDPLLQAIGEVCVPNCVYRCGCPESWSNCNFFKFKKNSILERYLNFNNFFSKIMDAENER